MDKSELREQLKARRQKLSAREVKHLSQQIINNCWQIIDWRDIYSVHSYLPIAKNNEIDTLSLLKAARRVNPELKIASSDPNSQTYWLDSDFQPTKKVPKDFQYDLIIVPLLAFDKSGYRLGYGGGFYDKFLAGQEQVLTIGLCYEFGHLLKLPREKHDLPLQNIITEKNIYKF
ncbi:5-formyltetrahydrofolate cyclo-ligase [Candidatus Saccharibacteria bacterium]|nr:5-formyltetrahydrofolate cyclo-ligase [Candidatus Saccharibacteria bacterium]